MAAVPPPFIPRLWLETRNRGSLLIRVYLMPFTIVPECTNQKPLTVNGNSNAQSNIFGTLSYVPSVHRCLNVTAFLTTNWHCVLLYNLRGVIVFQIPCNPSRCQLSLQVKVIVINPTDNFQIFSSNFFNHHQLLHIFLTYQITPGE